LPKTGKSTLGSLLLGDDVVANKVDRGYKVEISVKEEGKNFIEIT